jgi:hypothetical protein
MRPIVVLIALVSPSPSPTLEAVSVELAQRLALAHQCIVVAMDKHNAAPLEQLLDQRHAPVLTIVPCEGKPQPLRGGYAVRSWAYTHCHMPGPPVAEEPPPGAAVCKDRCCDVERSVRVCYDAKDRIRSIEYRCTAANQNAR